MDDRVPFLEITGLFDKKIIGNVDEEETKFKPSLDDSINFTANYSKSCTRIIKTHLSYEMLPEQVREKRPKIIYVTRNPRDAVVSFYNHWKVLEGFTGI